MTTTDTTTNAAVAMQTATKTFRVTIMDAGFNSEDRYVEAADADAARDQFDWRRFNVVAVKEHNS